MDVEELYFTENLNQSMDVLYMPSVLFWQLLRYMIIYWIYEQTVSENVKCWSAKKNFAKQHEEPLQSRKLSVGICEIIYFGFNLKDKESTWWISF